MTTEQILQLVRIALILIFVIFITFPIWVTIRNVIRKKRTLYFLFGILFIYGAVITYFWAKLIGLPAIKGITTMLAFGLAALTFYKIDELKLKNPKEKINFTLLLNDVYRESKGTAIDLARKYIILTLILVGLFILFYITEIK